MDKITKYLVVTFCIGLTLALFSLLLPEDKACGERDYTVINGVLFCKCSDNEYQKPGRCK